MERLREAIAIREDPRSSITHSYNELRVGKCTINYCWCAMCVSSSPQSWGLCGWSPPKRPRGYHSLYVAPLLIHSGCCLLSFAKILLVKFLTEFSAKYTKNTHEALWKFDKLKYFENDRTASQLYITNYGGHPQVS